MKKTVRQFLDNFPDAVAYGKRLGQAIDQKKISLKGSPYEVAKRAYDYERGDKISYTIDRFFEGRTNVMPRNPNLRIDLECDQNKWKFVLHKDSQAHCGVRGYSSPVEAVEEAMVLVSCLRLAAGRQDRLAKRKHAEFQR
jgi:hypothetical protein